MAIENKPGAKAAGKARAKGGHSSPLTVGFSGDEEQQPQPAIDNAAMHLHDGHPDIAKVQCARPVTKGGQSALTKTMHLLQEDEDLQSNSRAVQPETSVDCSTSVQVTKAPILPAAPSSPCKTELPAEHTGGNGQSGHVQDVPPPLLQNLPCAPSEDIHPSPIISNLDAPEPRHVDPCGAHNNHSYSSPALPNDDYHPSDALHGAYMYHEDLGQHAYARRP
ncbi:uncharacterized protein BJ212DRAFT_1487573 [Suillus subaureus]|uniref:Uncharacterized protein n=1 Tax=Suillus subaureus TaxID=48587 RepID=A0A9P7DSC5_9AGAM|nr:uncharacterized protein BJ212DRAFT_1487573 [Suillus subaureus]KAG1801845.1 hypothetical protein BJ212DRAFT_1487573 [Suillus subaureus]